MADVNEFHELVIFSFFCIAMEQEAPAAVQPETAPEEGLKVPKPRISYAVFCLSGFVFCSKEPRLPENGCTWSQGGPETAPSDKIQTHGAKIRSAVLKHRIKQIRKRK